MFRSLITGKRLAVAVLAVGSTSAFGQAPVAVLAEGSPAPATPPKGITIGPQGPMPAQPPPGQPAPPAPDAPEVYRLAITPAAEPVPPLKFRFSVSPSERQPGNSVPFYYRALVMFMNSQPELKAKFNEVLERNDNKPLAETNLEEIRPLLASFEQVFAELDRAALREETRWDWRLEELSGTEAISFLLPEIQESRTLARLLRWKALLEISEGRYGDAAKTLRSGYALAQAVAEPPTIINDLVGIAIASTMNDAVREWIGQPGSPNVYWALTSLPSPLIDLQPALEYELSLPYRFAPWLKDAETDVASPEVWRDRLARTFTDLQTIEPLMKLSATRDPKGASLAQSFVALLALRGYPAAKQALIERGFSPEQVDAMPVGQILAIEQKFVDDVIAQQLLKETFLPPIAGREVGDRAQEFLKQQGYFGPPLRQTGETVPLMALLAPATRAATHAHWRLDTSLAGLRTIEAIRMHAAVTGSFPKTLADVTVVPVPDNPTTDEPFTYTLSGETAVLEIVSDPSQPRRNWHVEMTLKK